MTDRRIGLLRDASKASAAFWQSLDETPSLQTWGEESSDHLSHYDEGLVLDSPNDIFRLVQELRRCLSELGAAPSADKVADRNRDVESWACLIYESMSAPSRTFHDVGHVFDISRGGDSLQIISALFHDVIYYTIDGGLSAAQAKVLDGVIVEEDGGAVSLSETVCSEDKHVAMVVTVFGFNPGQVLNPFTGLNEFLSAVLAVRCLKETLHDSYLLQIAACIEATVPFRKTDENGRTPSDDLHDRVCKANADMGSGLTELQIVKATQRAIDLANRDVGNFATEDHAEFLSNTWNLLPESNISLRSDVTGHISSFVMALKKMLGFLENLDPSVIYGSYQNEPSDDVVLNLTERAKKNLRVATKYLQLKVLGLSLIAALAELTGGDAPLIMFVRGMTVDETKDKYSHKNIKAAKVGKGFASKQEGRGRRTSLRIEDIAFQEDTSAAIPEHMSFIENFGTVQRKASDIDHYDDEVYSLLKYGRKVESKFDLINSPVAAYLYGMLGDTVCDRSFQFCACPMDSTNAKKLLDSLPPDAVALIARSCSRIVLTRAHQLMDIANLYSQKVRGERRTTIR